MRRSRPASLLAIIWLEPRDTRYMSVGVTSARYNWLERWTPVELKLARSGHCLGPTSKRHLVR